MSRQLYAPAALTPGERSPPPPQVPIGWEIFQKCYSVPQSDTSLCCAHEIQVPLPERCVSTGVLLRNYYYLFQLQMGFYQVAVVLQLDTQIHMSHKITHHVQTEHSIQSYTINKGYITHNEYKAKKRERKS
jgi:hypothetical protein